MPIIDDNKLMDQEGTGFITQLLSKKGFIVHDVRRDIGIDIFAELRDSNQKSTGKIICIQLKSGISYFRNEKTDHYTFYADHIHLEYWKRCVIPVIIALYHPNEEEVYWKEINKKTLIAQKNIPIEIPKKNRLSKLDINKWTEMFIGKIYDNNLDFKKIVIELIENHYILPYGLKISGLELYINGLIDRSKQLYFNADLICGIIEKKLSKVMDTPAYSFPNNDFFLEFFKIINYHNLIQGNFSFEYDTYHSDKLLPIFIKPLSINGLKFNDYLENLSYQINEKYFVNCGDEINYFYCEDE